MLLYLLTVVRNIFNFHSFISCQIVAGKKSINLIENNQEKFVLLEFFDQVDLVTRDFKQTMVPGSIFIGNNNILIINTSNDIASFRGIMFTNPEIKNTIPPLILSENSPNITVAKTILEKKITSQIDVKEVEQIFHHFFNFSPKSDKQSPSHSTPIKMDPRLIIIHRHIRKNYSQPLTLNTLADLIGCNPVYLSNTYSKVFKISPMRHLQMVRMDKAKEFIVSTSIPITEIAKNLGYVSGSQFSSLFKRYFSMTPYEYRLTHLRSKSN